MRTLHPRRRPRPTPRRRHRAGEVAVCDASGRTRVDCSRPFGHPGSPVLGRQSCWSPVAQGRVCVCACRWAARNATATDAHLPPAVGVLAFGSVRATVGDQKTAAKCNVREAGVEHTTSVSRYHSGVSPYEVYDMVGNVWEWLATAATRGRYELRGSAFTSPLFRGAHAISNDANEMMHDDDTGFRCVATPEQMEPRKR
ncbi:SUMF1/EgtB/PvdO family nonheme iron enzyme [Streptomyces sp. NPDC056821]|uniref:SUMF1/EgtB/PvdO family nonheme iron enzyme n=1 Tax=unclassified Streptomyces TaxID=2593676 RepID=UPI0036ADE4B0